MRATAVMTGGKRAIVCGHGDVGKVCTRSAVTLLLTSDGIAVTWLRSEPHSAAQESGAAGACG